MSGLNLIIVKILPLQPMPESDFKEIIDDLTITAYDLTVQDSITGVEIGMATSIPNPTPQPHTLDATIFQDFTETSGTSGSTVTRTYQSVATAVFVANPPSGHLEYLIPTQFDVRFVIQRNGIQMTGQYIEYNVNVVSVNELHKDEHIYIKMKPTAYLQLPPQVLKNQPGVGYVQMNSKGLPPDFDSLRQAVNDVLAEDHPTADLLSLSALEVRDKALTATQSSQIAYELSWNRSLNPTPMPPAGYKLHELYTIPEGQTSITDNDTITAQQQFQAQLTSYHATPDATAAQLTTYVFAASAAIFCERLSASATQAGLTVPVETDSTNTVSETSVILTGSPLNPSFVVPAAYFYFLGANSATQILYEQRYTATIILTENHLLSALRAGVDSGALPKSVAPVTVIGGTPINIRQAARRLVALGATNGSLPLMEMASVLDLISPSSSGWLEYGGQTANIDSQFWASAITKYPTAYVTLLLQAITQGATALVNDIEKNLSVATVSQLMSISDVQWQKYFASNAGLLPDFTKPGDAGQRVTVFLQRLRKFFTLPIEPPPAPSVITSPVPSWGIPAGDALQQFIQEYSTLQSASFDFSNPLDPTFLSQAVHIIFPNNSEARSWLSHAVETIHTLVLVTSTGLPGDLQFSLIEALYARGFTTMESINALMPDQFQGALAGTIAYPYASQIQTNSLSSPPPVSLPGIGFTPVNPDGSLTDCIPPPNLSPLGLIEYLHELLVLSFEGSTLEDYVSKRRGPLGNLLTTTANLEIPIPVIDLVNESLEALGGNLASDCGAVYDTNGQELDGFELSREPPGYNPSTMYETIPEHSSPATPVDKPTVYYVLKTCFTSPDLPYDEGLDICRSYLQTVGFNRFETMHHFRQDVTELAMDASLEPTQFQRHLWRFPVRLEIALEYLHLSYEEYSEIFSGTLSDAAVLELFGIDPSAIDPELFTVPEFLKFTGLNYCEFLELWRCKYVPFSPEAGATKDAIYPDCEPCCLKKLQISFGVAGGALNFALHKLFVFIRLWRRLRSTPGPLIKWNQLADICNVLGLFVNDTINGDFIRQLAALLILCDSFDVPLLSPSSGNPSATLEQRTQLLALWVGPNPAAAEWEWALNVLLEHVEKYAKERYRCETRKSRYKRELEDNLRPLAFLAGFTDVDKWHSKPTSTLRFAEVLSKIYASKFTIGEIIFLFTVDGHLQSDDPFLLPNHVESVIQPFKFPKECEYDLWSLRRKLLEAEITDVEVEVWKFHKIESAFLKLGYFPGPNTSFTDLAKHFFPFALATDWHRIHPDEREFRVDLPATATTELMWNIPDDGPFYYNSATQELETHLPIRVEAVINKLKNIRQLNSTEAAAVQNLYFAPRAAIAPFASIFENFHYAVDKLVHEPDEEERFNFFRRQFALFHRRCEIIADHLARHVSSVTDCELLEAGAVAWQILRNLLADENEPTVGGWENDSGEPPLSYLWNPHFSGSAFAALLGLLGTGLQGEFRDKSDALIWRDITGNLTFFGKEEDEVNAPIPTIIPSPTLTVSPAEQEFAIVLNGFAMHSFNGELLGGAQPFKVCWKGALLIENAGDYCFHVGAPRPGEEEPDFKRAEHHRWYVTLRRGHNFWTILNHEWETAEDAPAAVSIPRGLRRGTYQIEIHFEQRQPAFLKETHLRHLRTGFQLKYTGPDTDCCLVTVPERKLFLECKRNTLGEGLKVCPFAAAYLNDHFTSTLRDIRRTYQRAFKGVLFAHRFRLSGKPLHLPHRHHHWHLSELGYLLHHQEYFLGTSYYRPNLPGSSSVFNWHRAFFDLNFLPVTDPYEQPALSADSRVDPTLKRKAALFDWWERIFDYSRLRQWVEKARKRHVWTMFYEATIQQSPLPDQLLRYLDIDIGLAQLVLNYFANPTTTFQVRTSNFTDERWASRVWHAGLWLRELNKRFHTQRLVTAIPYLWASNDPNLLISGTTGNKNLTHLVYESSFGDTKPRSYKKVKQVNDGLRERARHALLAYLCGMDRTVLPLGPNLYVQSPRELSDLLLQDVEVGICERATRIEDAISSVHAFVQRGRLGLEPGFHPHRKFLCVWDSQYANFKIWEAHKRRELYRENWILWDELHESRRSEAFRSLEDNLRRSILTVPKPGGLVWWSNVQNPDVKSLNYLQSEEFASLQISSQSSSPALEGLPILGTPELDARLSWVAPLSVMPVGGPGSTPAATEALPLWVKAAVKMGTRFIRIAAATKPAAVEPYPRLGNLSHKGDCCTDCGKIHPAAIDEFYFWLADTHYFDGHDVAPQNASLGQNNLPDPRSSWDDPMQLPNLLSWTAKPMVHLFWCRIHFGRFDPPRRSDEGVPIASSTTGDPQLTFQGRTADSLLFGVSDTAFSSSTGFRYDMSRDSAIVVPQNPPVSTVYPSGFPAPLQAYPFFIYFQPGAPLIPPSKFITAAAIASTLHSRCCFEAALRWYEQAFNPLERVNVWAQCQPRNPPTPPMYEPPTYGGTDIPCCSSEICPPGVARGRAVLLEYLEVLFHWADSLRCHKSRDACQQAAVIFNLINKILGAHPKRVHAHDLNPTPMTVGTFKPVAPPLNPRLLALYDRAADWRSLVHRCTDAHCSCSGPRGSDLLRLGSECFWEACQPSRVSCHRRHPYRFSYLLPKALELVGIVRSLGASLLSAFEKGDAAYLESLRATYDRQLLVLGLDTKKNQFRESDWQVQSVEQALSGALCRLTYYQNLIKNGLNSGEQGYQDSTESSLASRAAANVSDGIAQGMAVTPDEFMGIAGIAGSPLDFMQLPIGTKLAGSFSIAARILNTLADIASTTAGLELTQGGWDRRLAEWNQQVDVITIELQQIERQKLAADRRKAISLRELNVQQRQIEHSIEVQDFMRDKFTKQDLYLFLQQETAALYRQFYDLALQAARETEQMFWYERRDTLRNFLPESAWDNLQDGLMAGERLELALRTMERAYMEGNCREYELTKPISLRMHFPAAFLLLKTTGRCEIDIPEWMFDFDYPGQYMRRIKNVSLTIPCVTGPYVGIHCRLQLLSSCIRVDPFLIEPAIRCCSDCSENDCGYESVPNDPRFVRQYGATDAIATSSGQDDTGLFQLNFNDERYLPFEFVGAISRWRIELPPENNQFDLNTLSDVVMKLNYTSREGGEVLRIAANEVAQRHLPGSGWRLFDIRHELPDAWVILQQPIPHEHIHGHSDDRPRLDRDSEHHRHEHRTGHRNLPLRFSRNMFPFLTGHREVFVVCIEVFIEARCATVGEHINATYYADGHDFNEEDEYCYEEKKGTACVATCEWPGLYHGSLEVKLGPLYGPRDHNFGCLRFQKHLCDIQEMYLLCRYEACLKDICAPSTHIEHRRGHFEWKEI